MCLSIPFKIYIKNISEIIKDCFGIKEDKYTVPCKSKINMDIIEAQPIYDKDDSVFLYNSGDELDKSYDFMDSD